MGKASRRPSVRPSVRRRDVLSASTATALKAKPLPLPPPRESSERTGDGLTVTATGGTQGGLPLCSTISYYALAIEFMMHVLFILRDLFQAYGTPRFKKTYLGLRSD